MKYTLLTLILLFALNISSLYANLDRYPEIELKQEEDYKASLIKIKNKQFYKISKFEYPEDCELHIKIWKDGKETEEYYFFEKGVGIKVNGKTIKFPEVAAMFCIKYGKKNAVLPFLIDLHNMGKGRTDLPGCNVEKADSPSATLHIILPTQIPNTNL